MPVTYVLQIQLSIKEMPTYLRLTTVHDQQPKIPETQLLVSFVVKHTHLVFQPATTQSYIFMTDKTIVKLSHFATYANHCLKMVTQLTCAHCIFKFVGEGDCKKNQINVLYCGVVKVPRTTTVTSPLTADTV